MSWETINPREELQALIEEQGGWVNTHAHIDRSYIINADNWSGTGDQLQAKWDQTDHFKASATVGQIIGKMSQVVENHLEQGVQALGSFIDCDSVVRDKNLQAADELRRRYGQDIQLVFMNQPIKGLRDETERAWFEEAADCVDIIGGLPERDSHDHPIPDDATADHLHTIFGIAAKQDKPLHIHVDQLNSPVQRDTEQIIEMTKRYGYAGRVTLIHSLSLAAQPKDYRGRIYRQLRDQDISVISCPTAWIDSRREERWAPIHNAITPVDELVPAGVRVALGTDNIADIYKPFSDGDMWTELRFLLEATHFYDLPALARIATVNGLKALNLEARPATAAPAPERPAQMLAPVHAA